MEDWRRNRSEQQYSYNNPNSNYYYQSGPKSRSQQYRKPPPPPTGYYQPDVPAWVASVPAWEKKFIANVGKMPWGRFVHCQKGLDLYNDVFQWDASANEEAFHNAKNRFWAEINGLPCDIYLPDPEMYIDEIDWYAKSDPELYKDLEKIPVDADVEEKDVKAGAGNPLCYVGEPIPIPPSGWDDDEPNWQGGDNKASNNDNPWMQSDGWGGIAWVSSSLSSLMKPIIPSGCFDGECDPSKAANNLSCNSSLQDGDTKNSNKNDPWEDNSGGWEGGWVSSSLTKNTNIESEGLNQYRNNESWGRGNENWRKRENEGQHLSRYKTTRYQSDDYQADHRWRNNRGRRKGNFAHEHSPMEPLAPRQWNSINTCGPISHHRPGEEGNNWGWDNQRPYHIN